MSFFQSKALVQPEELLGSIRVVVVGEPFVGKTALTELIASGHPAKASRSTAGCHIHVKLLDTPQQQHTSPGDKQQQDPSSQQRRFFVELWDVSGQPKYAQLRSVFYKQINGVILVYDLTNRKTLTKLPKWAAQIAHEGSFVAPFADELAARNIGGLPVPVLVVGNKADRMRHGSAAADAGSLASMINNACSQVLSSSACSSWWQRGIAGLRGRRAPSETSMAPDVEQHVKGLTASAAAGQLDWELLNGFFHALWERRFKPLTGGAHEYMHRTASFSGMGSSMGAAAAALKGPAGLMIGGSSSDSKDQRLDDDWV